MEKIRAILLFLMILFAWFYFFCVEDFNEVQLDTEAGYISIAQNRWFSQHQKILFFKHSCC